jgi:hypothetical protein
MNFIFLTSEGTTIGPGEHDVENLQVLGIVEDVKDEAEGLSKLLEYNIWIVEMGYDIDSITSHQIVK